MGLTLGPYAWKRATSDGSQASAPTAAEEDASTTADSPAATDVAAEEPTTTSSEPDLERAAEAMGIGGSAEADPDTNPLDAKLDKLLDGIE